MSFTENRLRIRISVVPRNETKKSSPYGRYMFKATDKFDHIFEISDVKKLTNADTAVVTIHEGDKYHLIIDTRESANFKMLQQNSTIEKMNVFGHFIWHSDALLSWFLVLLTH